MIFIFIIVLTTTILYWQQLYYTGYKAVHYNNQNQQAIVVTTEKRIWSTRSSVSVTPEPMHVNNTWRHVILSPKQVTCCIHSEHTIYCTLTVRRIDVAIQQPNIHSTIFILIVIKQLNLRQIHQRLDA